jgi:hypothetical protein
MLFASSQVFPRDGSRGVDVGAPMGIGAIMGIVFGILVIIALAAAGGLYYRYLMLLKKKPSESERDPTAEFFDHEQRDQLNEMSVDFNNPMFDVEGETLADPAAHFSDNMDEMI